MALLRPKALLWIGGTLTQGIGGSLDLLQLMGGHGAGGEQSVDLPGLTRVQLTQGIGREIRIFVRSRFHKGSVGTGGQLAVQQFAQFLDGHVHDESDVAHGEAGDVGDLLV